MLSIKDRMYDLLVRRIPEIQQKYEGEINRNPQEHHLHRGRSWKRLLEYNARYYFLRQLPDTSISFLEKNRLYTMGSESSLSLRESPQQLVERLKEYPVISFDVFDTLLLRPVANPADVFDFVGAKLSYLHFGAVRRQAEEKAREEKYSRCGTREVTLDEIYRYMENHCMGELAEQAMQLEVETEKNLCFAHPYFYEVYHLLRERGHQLLLISDMYLPSSVILELLEGCGYPAPDRIYVSCEYGKSKADGSLFRQVREECCQGKYLHIGDHPISDVESARKNGFEAIHTPNVQQCGSSYRPQMMSSLVRSVYSGIVNAHLHNGLCQYTPVYEYGYMAGGLLAVGYCSYIHRHTRESDKILFLSRDGELLYRVYRQMYPQDSCEYVYWSRRASLKLVSYRYKNEYFIRFVYDNVKKRKSVSRLVEEMDLQPLLDEIVSVSGLSPDEPITSGNVEQFCRAIDSLWEKVQQVYDSQQEGARRYWQTVLKGCRKACAVDIGWVGSGSLYLRNLVMDKWCIPCEINGLLAGSASAYVPGSEGDQGLFQNGVLDAYLFSQEQNRALWCEHHPGKRHNVYLEMLFTSASPSLRGFLAKGEDEFELMFCEPEKTDPQTIAEIQQGILDFAWEYQFHLRNYPEMLQISGGDAYAPFRLAVQTGEKYWKLVFPNLHFQEELLP